MILREKTGKLTMSIAIFNNYVKLPEGIGKICYFSGTPGPLKQDNELIELRSMCDQILARDVLESSAVRLE